MPPKPPSRSSQNWAVPQRSWPTAGTRLFAKQLGVAEFKDLVQNTRAYLKTVPAQTEATNAQLMEIIMAQDFQDLTGQVIKKILTAAQNLEKELVNLLLETTPEDKRPRRPAGTFGRSGDQRLESLRRSHQPGAGRRFIA
jgi:chemotaxis regulatin CheY-phosphate phosphatase CheZ